MWTRSEWGSFGKRLVFAAAAVFAIWAYSVSHVIIQWVDGPAKRVAALLLALGLAVVAVLVARQGGRRWQVAWWVIFGAFALGEGHRVWLRYRYGVDAAPIDPFHTVTTTDLKVRSFTLGVPALGTERVRVAHLTDLHVTEAFPDAFTLHVHETLRATDPDLVVMTGDYLSRIGRLPLLVRWLERMPKPRFGAYAVLGNHDLWTREEGAVLAAFERASVRMLRGTCETARVKDGAVVRLCGTEHPWGPKTSALPRDGVPTLVLSHTPDNVYDLASEGADVVFAGHTHGGQIRLPLLGAIVIPSDYGRRFDRGHFVVEQTHLYVSAGVGADSPPLRLWCPPELVVVDLVGPARRAPAAQMGL
jgi:predicted MPP superfamily phosphohydrolase